MARWEHLRVVVDANVVLSYLLRSLSDAPPAKLIRLALRGRIHLLVASESSTEISDKIVLKPYLAARLSQTDLAAVVASLARLGEVLPTCGDDIPLVARDRKD